MSSAVLRIQVATLSDVPDGQSRIDGVPNQVVTLRSVGSGSTHDIAFFDVVNPGVAGATEYEPNVPVITASGDGRSWTFTPPGGAGAWGQTFGFELVVDRGLPTQVRTHRIYAIPTELFGLILPVFSEGADPQASLENSGTVQVANSTDNHDGNWRGYHPKMIQWLRAIENPIVRTYRVDPSPHSFRAADILGEAAASTDLVRLGTIFLPVCTITQVVADYGDEDAAGEENHLLLRRQGPDTVMFDVSRTGLRAMATHALSVAVANAGAYELFAQSDAATGEWVAKGVEITVEV